VSHKTATGLRRLRLTVRGRVQGVGFRPTLYRELTRLGCAGTIRNTPDGALLEIEAPPEVLERVLDGFADLVPSRARVDELLVEEADVQMQVGFSIERSSAGGESLLPIPPDLATCPDCLRELRSDTDRRQRYAFNTCTACGPRFTIARTVPFDRPTSAMDAFPLCKACRREYSSPADRRFHAQTISCPACGPRLSFEWVRGVHASQQAHPPTADPIERTRHALKAGRIVALKGLGGFHLACDATRADVVAELRRRKARPHKPMAVMVRDLATCRRLCRVGPAEEDLLTSAASPIVLLESLRESPIAAGVAPGLRHLGVMLPYTPLHAMLFDDPEMPPALVMTSCNRSDEPIATSRRRVVDEMGDIVDAVLDNNRPILNRCDDSVLACFQSRPLPMRRSRGYVPEAVLLKRGGPPVLGTGAMWKNTFALSTGRRVFLSQHIGDVSDADTAAHYRETFRRFSELLRLRPEVVACDMHPDYPTTAFAEELAAERGLPLIRVQHHHAHVASCLAENGADGPAIGVSMDGTGYGEDGAIWGGEFIIATAAAYERRHHLAYVPMPGGDQAVLYPHRMALSHLSAALGEQEAVRRIAPRLGEATCRKLLQISGRPDFSPPTSSCGRLFDALAALLDVQHEATYEGQPACELEAACDPHERGAYAFERNGENISVSPVLASICADLDRGTQKEKIAARFHNAVADMIVETCVHIREETGIETVALSGGVMQNRFLLARAVPALRQVGFTVLLHAVVPPNDGGICLGQIACVLARLEEAAEGNGGEQRTKCAGQSHSG